MTLNQNGTASSYTLYFTRTSLDDVLRATASMAFPPEMTVFHAHAET